MVGLAVAANLDNAGVGIAYGVRKIRIAWLPNMMVALISGVATLISGWVGRLMRYYIHPDIATALGAVVIFLVALWVMAEPLREKRKQKREHQPTGVIGRILNDPSVADFDASKSIGMLEAVVLGTALAMNAFAGGFDAGVTQLNIFLTSFLVALFSYLLLGIAALFGRRYAARALGDHATVIAGLILVVIAVHQIW
jgi:putative sporulation protein YtaF